MKEKNKQKSTLYYDENTKIINVNRDIPTTNKFKRFCEQNKVYFETVLMLILTISGIVVSIVGVKVGIIANNIAENDNYITDLEKQPTFVCEKEISENSEKYIIRNTGGSIRYGSLFLDKAIVITLYNEDYTYLGKGYIILGDYIENRYSKYDFDTQTFTISTKSVSNSKLVLQWIETLKNILINEGYFYGIICTEHIDLMYQNYKQESLTKDMVVDNEILRDFDSNNEYYFKKYVNVNELDAEQLKEDIKQEINLLLQYH